MQKPPPCLSPKPFRLCLLPPPFFQNRTGGIFLDCCHSLPSAWEPNAPAEPHPPHLSPESPRHCSRDLSPPTPHPSASTWLPTVTIVVLLKYAPLWAFSRHNPLIMPFYLQVKANVLKMSLQAALSGSSSPLWPLLFQPHWPACFPSLGICTFCPAPNALSPESTRSPSCKPLFKCHSSVRPYSSS